MNRIYIEGIYRSQLISAVSEMLGEPRPLFVGDTETYDVAVARTPLGVFIIAVFDTSPRTLLIGQLPRSLDPEEIEKKIEEIVDRHPSSYEDAIEELVELMDDNGIAYVEHSCELDDHGHHCRLAR